VNGTDCSWGKLSSISDFLQALARPSGSLLAAPSKSNQR
jgi:hypothetical protein